jgi:hypothetical protein
MTEYLITLSGSSSQVGILSQIHEDNSDRGMRYFNHSETTKRRGQRDRGQFDGELKMIWIQS